MLDTQAALQAHHRLRHVLPRQRHWIEDEATPYEAALGARPTLSGYVKGERLRVIGGGRAGMVVTFLKSAGAGRGGISLRVTLPDGRRGSVMAKYVERA